jgi:hypothetical protein
LFNAPALIPRVGRLLPWRQKDRNGQTPLFALCRSYDHGNYRAMVEAALVAAGNSQGDNEPLHLDDHVDSKGNTLLHIVNDPQVALRILHHCDADVNATNDKKFTALMVASKYGRLEMVRALFGDRRVDLFAKELRGLTAVELAKDDDVRNRIDDLILFSGQPGNDGRITAVVRSFFVEDATIRLVVKSGAPSNNQSFTVTTCRRSLTDFEHLAQLLALENPASWLPTISGMHSPFQLPSKPSRAVLRDIQVRLDGFLKILLAHSTFSTHEMLWEFFLVPDIQAEQMEARSKLKAQARVETVRDEFEPLTDLRDVEQFVNHARDQVRGVNMSIKRVARTANLVKICYTGKSPASDHNAMYPADINRSLQCVHSGNSRNLNPGMFTRNSHISSPSLRANSRPCLLVTIRRLPLYMPLDSQHRRRNAPLTLPPYLPHPLHKRLPQSHRTLLQLALPLDPLASRPFRRNSPKIERRERRKSQAHERRSRGTRPRTEVYAASCGR